MPLWPSVCSDVPAEVGTSLWEGGLLSPDAVLSLPVDSVCTHPRMACKCCDSWWPWPTGRSTCSRSAAWPCSKLCSRCMSAEFHPLLNLSMHMRYNPVMQLSGEVSCSVVLGELSVILQGGWERCSPPGLFLVLTLEQAYGGQVTACMGEAGECGWVRLVTGLCGACTIPGEAAYWLEGVAVE